MIGLTNATIKSSTEPTPTTVIEKDINFYALKSDESTFELVGSFELSELPLTSGDLPIVIDTERMSFTGWNISLSSINACKTKLNVGAFYKTKNNKIEALIDVDDDLKASVSPNLNINFFLQSISITYRNNTINVEVFDLSNNLINSYTTTDTANQAFGITISDLPTYTNGKYRLVIDLLNNTANSDFFVYYGTNSTVGLFSGDASKYITHIYLPANNPAGHNYYFSNVGYFCRSNNSLATLVGNIDFGYTSTSPNAFDGCPRLTHLFIRTFPSGTNIIYYPRLFSCDPAAPVGTNTSLGAQAFTTYLPSNRVLVFPRKNSISASSINAAFFDVLDFTYYTSIPSLDASAITNITVSPRLRILVPVSLYSSWITATNWSTYASYIEGV